MRVPKAPLEIVTAVLKMFYNSNHTPHILSFCLDLEIEQYAWRSGSVFAHHKHAKASEITI